MAIYKDSNGVKRELRVFENGNNEVTVATGYDNDTSVCISIPHQELANLLHEAGIVLPEPEVKPRFRVGDIVKSNHFFHKVLWVSEDDGDFILVSEAREKVAFVCISKTPYNYVWDLDDQESVCVVGHYDADTDTYTPNE